MRQFCQKLINLSLMLFMMASVSTAQSLQRKNCLSLFESQNETVLFDSEIIKQSQKKYETEIAKTHDKINSNSFVTNRGYAEYNTLFKFETFLDHLTSQDRWLDAGAGRAKAQIEYLEKRKLEAKDSLQMVALAFKKPWFTQVPKENFKYISGSYFEDIPDYQLGLFSVITDYFGPFSYSKNPVAVLNKYLRLLKAGGKIFISSTPYQSSIYVPDQGLISLHTWIQKYLEKFPDDYKISKNLNTLEIQSVSEVIQQLPDAELIYFFAESPPVRKLLLTPGKNADLKK